MPPTSKQRTKLLPRTWPSFLLGAFIAVYEVVHGPFNWIAMMFAGLFVGALPVDMIEGFLREGFLTNWTEREDEEEAKKP